MSEVNVIQPEELQRDDLGHWTVARARFLSNSIADSYRFMSPQDVVW